MFRTLVSHILTFEDYISSGLDCKTAHLCIIRNMRESDILLAFIISLLDYCNALFISLVNKTIDRHIANLYHPVLSAKKHLLTFTAPHGPSPLHLSELHSVYAHLHRQLILC